MERGGHRGGTRGGGRGRGHGGRGDRGRGGGHTTGIGGGGQFGGRGGGSRNDGGGGGGEQRGGSRNSQQQQQQRQQSQASSSCDQSQGKRTSFQTPNKRPPPPRGGPSTSALAKDNNSKTGSSGGVLSSLNTLSTYMSVALQICSTAAEIYDLYSKTVEKSKAVTEDISSRSVLCSFKILSYNVWFREDVEVLKRMEAIGDLIQLYSPDIICFQEVTTNIYKILRQSSWWKVYFCSVSYEMAHSKKYFCMQLSKLPVKSFSTELFGNSKMGRGLCTAEVEVEHKRLVVATSHLESPCPAPPNWNQMYSEERVDQAKLAINLLEKNPNVIFCGDMNWDDKLDGQFPLPDGWVDAWTNLRPGENGWTYDTMSNKMLSGNFPLQKRLDRFVCNLRDFRISRIDMIGMEAIPGLSYCKEKKVRNTTQKLDLPVLPSDHYGLLLTICSR